MRIFVTHVNFLLKTSFIRQVLLLRREMPMAMPMDPMAMPSDIGRSTTSAQLKHLQDMNPTEILLSNCPADCFWLCDGTIKELPNPPRIYFGSAAVNAATLQQRACGGKVAQSHKLRFYVREAELVSILCALQAALDMPRKHLIIVTDDNSRDQAVHLEVIRHWTLEEINEQRHMFRAPILSSIRMSIYELLTEREVNSIFLVNTNSLDEIRREIIQKRDGEWEPHWISRDKRQECEKGGDDNMFQIGAPKIWDWTKVLPKKSLWNKALNIERVYFCLRGSGYRFSLQEQSIFGQRGADDG